MAGKKCRSWFTLIPGDDVSLISEADVSLIPKSVGDLLGFKIEANDKIEEIRGIGEQALLL